MERYKIYLETLTPESLHDLPRHVTDQVHFKDPFNDVRGAEHMQRVFQHMFENLEDIRFTIHQAIEQDNICMMEWRFKSRLQGQDWCFDGVSTIRFSEDGRVQSHIDYWDAADNFYVRLPLIGALIRWIRKRVTTP